MTENDFEKNMQEALKQARLDVDFFTKLAETQGWLRLKDIADAQVKTRTDNLLNHTDLALREKMTSSDFEKGVIQGIRLIMGLPAWCVTAAQDTLKQHEVAKDELDEDA